jgi:hypothetical protein
VFFSRTAAATKTFMLEIAVLLLSGLLSYVGEGMLASNKMHNQDELGR